MKSVIKRFLGFDNTNALNGKNWFQSKLSYICNSFLCRLDIEASLRYRPVVKFIREHGNKASSILEVGSGSVGITPFLGRKCTGVDINFSGPDLGLLQRNIGQATELGYKDNSFDFVISVDMLEHLPPAERKKAVFQMVRVAKRYVLIAVPCSKESERYEHMLSDFLRKKNISIPVWLKEHLEYRLPDEDILSWMQEAAVKSGINSVKVEAKNNLNVKLWFFLRALSDGYPFLIYFPIMLFLRALYQPFLLISNRPNYYRRIFILRKDTFIPTRRKVNILFVNCFAEIGGAELTFIHMVNGLDQRLFRPLVILPRPGPLSNKLELCGAKIFYVKMSKLKPKNPLPFVRTVISIWRIAKKEEAAILFAVDPLSNQYGLLAARMARVPIIVYVQDILNRRAILRMFLPFSDIIIANSEATAKSLFSNGIDKRKVQLIYPVLANYPLLPTPNSRNRIRSEFKVDDNTFLIGVIGRVVPLKGQDILINAFAQVLNVYDNCRLLIVGETKSQDPNFSDRDYIRSLQLLIEKLHLTGKVILVGHRDDIADIYEALDLLVSASLSESFGRAIFEAMYLGKPVIASAVGAIAELITDRVTGRLVPPNNPAEMAKAILELINDKELARRLGENGRKYVLDKFLPVRQVMLIQELIKSLVETRRRL